MIKQITLPILGVILLAGCSGGILKSTEPPQTTYMLRPASVALHETGPARIVEIPKPAIPPGFSRDRIALYLQNGQKLDYYATARWPAPFDEVIQNFTRRSLTAALPYVVTVSPTQPVDPDYRLEIKVNEFQPVYAGSFSEPPMLKVNLEFSLVRLSTEKIASSFTLNQERRANSARLDVIIAELETMLQETQTLAFEKLEPALKVK